MRYDAGLRLRSSDETARLALVAAVDAREALLNETAALSVELEQRDMFAGGHAVITQPVRFVRRALPGARDSMKFVLNGARIMSIDAVRGAAIVAVVLARAPAALARGASRERNSLVLPH